MNVSPLPVMMLPQSRNSSLVSVSVGSWPVFSLADVVSSLSGSAEVRVADCAMLCLVRLTPGSLVGIVNKDADYKEGLIVYSVVTRRCVHSEGS